MTAHVSGGRRTIVAMAVVAVLCLVAGVLLSRLIDSPGAAAADAAPPTAGPITVPVERRVIGNEVVLRGDVGYDDPIDLRVEAGADGAPAVVTGQVKEVGATLDPGAVALEVVGRPVVVLPGELPTYRTLRAGVSGPDVQQLRWALQVLGIDGGDPADATYDASAAAGVRALYQRVGYEPPSAGEEATEAAKAAREAVTAAQEGVRSAQALLAGAASPAAGASVTELDGAVRVAEARMQFLGAQCALPAEQRDQSAADCSPPALVQADADLQTARAGRAAAGVAPDTSAERAAVRAAQDQLNAARTALQQAEADTLTPLPSAEVVYLPSLPRRVDAVEVRRGSTISGPFMTVSGATVQVTASVSRADAELLAPGAAGTIPLDDTEVAVTVAEVTAAKAGDAADDGQGDEGAEGGGGESSAPTGDRRTVVFTVGALTPEQLTALQGTNVRVRVPVSSTDGEVLAVPLAALTAGPGGESRVEVSDGAGGTRLVVVTTGLAAEGYVEITGAKEPLEEGDLVVVGASGTQDEDEDEPSADATEDA
ncbi:hypothetical protein [Cellulomonas shaoxiangyii]|uniref:Peptidoglycan-binding protein n=1 Tax=Cellulomonas shaoxiangyii TaxID=2566013 RepID=A0A4V1CMI1_9CELL|nr:hypothetical protein [Cellulomonas shaoxiangyii]QCB93025.1 hypothetical protein E5225_05080 [Cellulomonas shaoxiangyii]TGY85559.1 hypothetical protein E5226_05875 [Cellulomonas shaoxiangyii]